MNGENTIIITLKWYFRVSEDEIGRFDEICKLLLSGLIDETDEITPRFDDMDKEINALADIYWSDIQSDVVTVQNDLWTILVNWWDAVKWARRGVRVLIETADLIADLVEAIANEISNNPQTKPYHHPFILQALIQRNTPPRYTITRYVQQRLPKNTDLDAASGYYRKLSHKHGFGDEYHVLLQLLSDKMTRNRKRHTYFIVQDYIDQCRIARKTPSYDDYISCRGITLSPALLIHCRRLFRMRFRM